jgi:hypothetical protein
VSPDIQGVVRLNTSGDAVSIELTGVKEGDWATARRIRLRANKPASIVLINSDRSRYISDTTQKVAVFDLLISQSKGFLSKPDHPSVIDVCRNH